MKYKLKFEITYPDVDKALIREAKLELINSGTQTEIESDYPIPVPNKKSTIILGEREYEVVDVKYKLQNDEYTTICEVTSQELLIKVEKQKNNRDLKELYKQILSRR